jgi:hypothetical protein
LALRLLLCLPGGLDIMTADRTKPLRVGQVLEGLLEDGKAGADDQASPVETYCGSEVTAEPALPVTIWERMMAAVDQKFDGDNDGDVRGKG